MAQLNSDSPFVSWVLTEDELTQGHILTVLQKQCVQNYIHDRVVEKMNLPWVPENIQREAELKGEIAGLQYMIAMSDEMEVKFREQMAAQTGRE